jgi:hypothetical protein
MVAQPLRELLTLTILFLCKLPKVCGLFSALQLWQFDGCASIGIVLLSQRNMAVN